MWYSMVYLIIMPMPPIAIILLLISSSYYHIITSAKCSSSISISLHSPCVSLAFAYLNHRYTVYGQYSQLILRIAFPYYFIIITVLCCTLLSYKLNFKLAHIHLWSSVRCDRVNNSQCLYSNANRLSFCLHYIFL